MDLRRLKKNGSIRIAFKDRFAFYSTNNDLMQGTLGLARYRPPEADSYKAGGYLWLLYTAWRFPVRL